MLAVGLYYLKGIFQPTRFYENKSILHVWTQQTDSKILQAILSINGAN